MGDKKYWYKLLLTKQEKCILWTFIKKNLIHISSRNYRNIDFAVNKGSIVKLHLSENSSNKN